MNNKKWIVVCVVVLATIFAVYTLEYSKNSTLQLQTMDNFNKTNYSVTEFKLPDAKAAPLFPTYDKTRNVIWIGDTKTNSSRMWEFDLDSKKFVEHHLSGIDIITTSFLDSNGTIWYIDPTYKLLGNYNPLQNINKLVKIPTNGTISGLVVDFTGAVWITVPNLDQILRYDISRNNFTTILFPTTHASPLSMDVDKKSGHIWIVEAIGQIAELNPSNYKITEYVPSGNDKIKLPVAIKNDPNSDAVYIAEHGEDAVYAFYKSNDNFKRLELHHDPDALPYGMTFDAYGNLWVAQHTVNKIAVIEPETMQSSEIEIPSADPLVQWLTSDSQGNVWFAEPGNASLGVIEREGTLLQNVNQSEP